MKIEVCLEIKKETDMAILVTDGVTKGWIPKSKIEIISSDSDENFVIIKMPEWLAKNKGFI
jgi:hypothetical protein